MQGFEDATLQAQLWTHEVRVHSQRQLNPYQFNQRMYPCEDPRILGPCPYGVELSARARPRHGDTPHSVCTLKVSSRSHASGGHLTDRASCVDYAPDSSDGLKRFIVRNRHLVRHPYNETVTQFFVHLIAKVTTR